MVELTQDYKDWRRQRPDYNGHSSSLHLLVPKPGLILTDVDGVEYRKAPNDDLYVVGVCEYKFDSFRKEPFNVNTGTSRDFQLRNTTMLADSIPTLARADATNCCVHCNRAVVCASLYNLGSIPPLFLLLCFCLLYTSPSPRD